MRTRVRKITAKIIRIFSCIRHELNNSIFLKKLIKMLVSHKPYLKEFSKLKKKINIAGQTPSHPRGILQHGTRQFLRIPGIQSVKIQNIFTSNILETFFSLTVLFWYLYCNGLRFYYLNVTKFNIRRYFWYGNLKEL